MSVVRKLASQTALYGLTYFAGRLLNFLLTPFYTYYFTDTGDFGAMTLIYSYITFFNVLYTYGMETGYFYFANKPETKERPVEGTAFLSLLYSSILFSGLLMVLSPWLAELLGFPDSRELVIYASLILFFDTIAVIPFAQLRKEGRAYRFALFKFINIILNIFFNLFFLIICPAILENTKPGFIHDLIDGIYSPGHDIAYVFIANILASALVILFLIPEIRRVRFQFDTEIWKKILKYSWPLLILGFAGMVNETLGRIMLQYRLPGTLEQRLDEIGIYTACYRLSMFMTLAIQAFRYAAEPFFFSSLREEDSKKTYARLLQYFSFATSLIFLGVVLFLPIVIKILGENFRGADEVVPILLVANLFFGLFTYLSQWYKQTEKTLYGAYITVAGAVLTIGLNYFLIPVYGYIASAWANFFCYFFMAVTTYLAGQKYFPVAFNVRRILLYIGGAVILFFFSRLIETELFGGFSLGMYMVNTLLILLFIVLFIYMERPAFLWERISSKNRNIQNN